jgi:hypothetical protein
MAAFLLISFAAGAILAIPVWIVRQHVGARGGLRLARDFDPRDAMPCDLDPVALHGRLLPPPGVDGEVRS